MGFTGLDGIIDGGDGEQLWRSDFCDFYKTAPFFVDFPG